MRLLLLLMIALGSAFAAPFLVYGAQPDLLTGGGRVGEAWDDLQEMIRLAFEAWRSGREPAPDALWSEPRVRRALAMLSVAVAWLIGFLPGGLLGLMLMNARPVTLAVLGAVIALALYSCTSVQVSHDLAPDTVATIKRLAGLSFAAALAGFMTTRAFRKITV